MKPKFNGFEDYISLLAGRGVFPTFYRYENRWGCVLRNSSDIQIMPFEENEKCWAETMVQALISAVGKLNESFYNPKDLFDYINTGQDKMLVEALLKEVEALDEIKTPLYAAA